MESRAWGDRDETDEAGPHAAPHPIARHPPKCTLDAHLSPRGSRTANLISLPKTWLICGQRGGQGHPQPIHSLP